MTIYVELALIENFLITFLLLKLTAYVLKIKLCYFNIITAALLGAIFAVLMPLITLGKMGNFAAKLLFSVVVVKVGFWQNVRGKKYVISSLTFLAVTFALGGLISALYEIFDIQENSYSLFNLSVLAPLCVSITCIASYYVLLKKLLKALSKRIKISKCIYSIKISVAGNKEEFSAFYDSGNRLTDVESGLPINILSVKTFNKLCPSVSLADIILEKRVNLKNAHFVNYQVVGARKKILVFEPDEFWVFAENARQWSERKCLVGVSLGNFKDTLDYEMLLNGGISMEGL